MHESESTKVFREFVELLEANSATFHVDHVQSASELRLWVGSKIKEVIVAWGYSVNDVSPFTWEYLYDVVNDDRCLTADISELQKHRKGSAYIALDFSDEAIIILEDSSELPINLRLFDLVMVAENREWIYIYGHEPYAEHTVFYPTSGRLIAFENSKQTLNEKTV